jgi:hypothetical protein
MRLPFLNRTPIPFIEKDALRERAMGKHEIHRLETVFLTVNLAERTTIDHYFTDALDDAAGVAFAFKSPSAY